MSDVLGLELNEAVSLLTKLGKKAEASEVRSKKGQSGNEMRVVRQKELDGVVSLTYAAFKTVIDYE